MLNFKPITYCCLAVNLVSFSVVAANIIGQRVSGQNAITRRSEALVNVAKHHRAKTCWELPSNQPLKLGDTVSVAGSKTGLIPSECIHVPGTKQFLQVGYKAGQLKVLQVFSYQELRNQLSVKESE